MTELSSESNGSRTANRLFWIFASVLIVAGVAAVAVGIQGLVEGQREAQRRLAEQRVLHSAGASKGATESTSSLEQIETPKAAERQADTGATFSGGNDEKKKLLNHPSYCDFRRAKKTKQPGRAYLRVWEPYARHIESLPAWVRESIKWVQPLDVECDEVWTCEADKTLTPAERKRWKGQVDIMRLYWKGNMAQAVTVESYCITDPLTGLSLPDPGYRLMMIHNRATILEDIAREN
jgi:hypothetical protein